MTTPFRKILARWPVVAITTFLCLVLAVATLPSPSKAAKGPKTYRAQVTLGLTNNQTTTPSQPQHGSKGGAANAPKQTAASAKLTAHFLALTKTPAFLAFAAKTVGKKETPSHLAAEVGFVADKVGDIVVKSRDHSAAKSAAVAAAVAKALITAATQDETTNQKAQVTHLQQELATLGQQIRSLEASGAASTPTSTSTSTSTTSTTSTTVARQATTAKPGSKKAASATRTAGTTRTATPRRTSSPSRPKVAAKATPQQSVNSVQLHTVLGLYSSIYHTLLVTETRNTSKAPLQVIAVKKPALQGAAKSHTVRKRYWLAGGLFLGLLLGILIAVLLGLLDRSVTDESRAEELTGLPVLAYIPASSSRHRGDIGPEVVERPVSPVAESYRRLTSALERAPGHVVEFAGSSVATAIDGRAPEGGSRRGDGTRQLLGLVGTTPGSGCSTVVVNLAATLAEFGFEPVAVDANLRSPSLHALLGVERQPGVADGLEPLFAPFSSLAPGVRTVPAGGAIANPSAALQQLVTDLPGWRRQVQVAILDMADLSSANDAAVLAGELDGLVLVCARRTLTPRRAPRIVRDLGRVPTPVLGLVLVEVPSARFGLSRIKWRQSGRSRRARAPQAQPANHVDGDTVDARPGPETNGATDGAADQEAPAPVEPTAEASRPEDAPDDAIEASWRST
jgi:Mrp family chromosome partitioning ATPase/capsular polysaccharide biosynthesis protein